MTSKPDVSELFGAGHSDTFLGLPACIDLDTLSARAAIIGVPGVTPYASVGPYCANAPRAIRDAIAGYAANLEHVDFDLGRPLFAEHGVDVADCGDLPFDDVDFARNRVRLRETVTTMLDRGAVPIVIGGDDSVPIPLFEAFAGRGAFTVVQVDAHIDWRDNVDGERYGLSSNMRRASEMAHIERIIQIGQRAMGSARPDDLRDAREWGVHFHPASTVAREGVSAALAHVPKGANVLLTIDIDGLDPSVVPGVIGRAPGGLSYWDAVEVIHGVASKANLVAFDLVEFMPERDVDQLGALVAARLVVNAIGVCGG